jgi:parvulin-like peptidyl-prolyl isomerase
MTTTGSGMVQEFTDASIALAVGGVSAPVQTDYGFHIIKRYPIDIESINAELDKTRERITELNALPSLSFVDDAELKRLKQQEASLENQLKLKEMIAKNTEQQHIKKTEE